MNIEICYTDQESKKRGIKSLKLGHQIRTDIFHFVRFLKRRIS